LPPRSSAVYFCWADDNVPCLGCSFPPIGLPCSPPTGLEIRSPSARLWLNTVWLVLSSAGNAVAARAAKTGQADRVGSRCSPGVASRWAFLAGQAPSCSQLSASGHFAASSPPPLSSICLPGPRAQSAWRLFVLGVIRCQNVGSPASLCVDLSLSVELCTVSCTTCCGLAGPVAVLFCPP